jgi:hypothetical protein
VSDVAIIVVIRSVFEGRIKEGCFIMEMMPVREEMRKGVEYNC